MLLFQSTQPKRAATSSIAADRFVRDISIHAAQEGCDWAELCCRYGAGNFNPRSPRGLRLHAFAMLGKLVQISIHAAQEGCDIVKND